MSGRNRLGLHKVFITHAVVMLLPALLYVQLRMAGVDLFWLHVGVASVYLLTAIMVMSETIIASVRRFAGPRDKPHKLFSAWLSGFKQWIGLGGSNQMTPSQPVPRSTLIVAAYLPNEQDIIIETLTHILRTVKRPAAGLEVILAYNRHDPLPVEQELAQLARQHPELRLLNVPNSHSKAENLNMAMDLATGEIIGILDADHHPAGDSLERAWRWLDSDYDVVQGRSIIRNHSRNWQTRMIAVEFECIYGVAHPARSLMVDTGIFGGSNGYWRAGSLRRVRFDQHMLTEDIDASVRSLLSGCRIVHDRSIVSTELAPEDFRSFWFQRIRWAQGWLQVSLKYQVDFWRSKHLNLGQKLYWTYMLSYRELFPLIALQVIPLAVSLWWTEGRLTLWSDHPFLMTTAILTLLSGPFQTITAMKNAAGRYPVYYPLLYASTVLVYAMLKSSITLVAIYNHLRHVEQWVVTARNRPDDKPANVEQEQAA